MALTADQITRAGYASMTYEIRQKPEDLYNTARPLLKFLASGKKMFPGSKDYIRERLRTKNDSNFQWFNGDDEVTYNRKDTLRYADFSWGEAHDGFALNETELLQNYISVTDDPSAAPTTSETHQFVNLMKENTETLKLGFKEKLDYALHLDGTQDANAIVGLDGLIALDPTTGIVGGINRATAGNEYWRNNYSTNIASTSGTLTTEMEKMWRACIRVGGSAPDKILVGSKFLDAYRTDCKSEIDRQLRVGGRGGTDMDSSVSKLYFKGVELEWDPVMDDLQANLSVSSPGEWDKRCYFLNSRYLKLRPAEGQDMIVRKPPRAYNRYAHYWGLTWRGGLTTTHPRSMAVLSID